MIVLDTTVLVYAVGGEHPLRTSCRRLLEAIADRTLTATTTPEVVQEFVHVRSRRRDRSDSVRLGLEWTSLLAPLVVVDEPTLTEGLHLYERVAGLGSFDAILAATARRLGAHALVSADQRFTRVPDIHHVVPDAVGVDGLLHDSD